MANERRAITVVDTVAITASEFGPPLPRYRFLLDTGRIYKWIPANVLTADSVAVVGSTGGTVGNWVEVRRPEKGADLTDAAATIYVGGNALRVLPAATLSANRVLTLGTTNAAAGDAITITRLDVGAYTYAIANGGTGGGTLMTMPVSSRYFADVYFDGTNWLIRRAGAFAA